MASQCNSYLIVGASGTIGSALVARLAKPGVWLGLHYCSNASAVDDLRQRVEQAGARAVCLRSSLDSDTSCQALVEQARSEGGPIHALALCGGRVPWKAWQELDSRDWQAAFFEHCVAPVTLARAFVPSMVEQGGGRIVFLSSVAAKYGGSPRSIQYAAAKGALETAMRGLSRELASFGVCVNGVRSGFVDSPQQRAGRSAQEIADRIGKIPMRRPGKPEEIAAALQFLLSPEAGFITGEIITAAGGD